MKKLLIYMPENEIKPTGGPCGYLWNLKSEIKKNNDLIIDFLPCNNSSKSSFKSGIIKFYELVTKKTAYIRAAGNIVSCKKKCASVDLNQYDAVHFHSTYKLYMAKDSLENYKGKVILTSHSPKALHKEFIEDYITEDERRKFKSILKNLYIMDEYSFNRADAIIFPCKEAEEPYYHSWVDYPSIHEKNALKYHYVPTGIVGKTAMTSRENVRKLYGIPDNAFLICYVGRHNEVKGYDFLKDIGKIILKKYSNVYFIVAGKEEPLKGLDNSRWIECGWTQDAASIIHASDLFILPNKETYFDLITLEVLSLGTPIIMTRTGGNKYFEQYKTFGISYIDYGNIEEAMDTIAKYICLSNNEINIIRNNNLQLFENNFNTKIFYKKYLKTIINILSLE